MGQGDTKVQIDFSVGGASAAKMTVRDVYEVQQREMEATKKKIGDLSRQYNMSERDVAKALRAINQMQAREASASAKAQNKADQEATQAARLASHMEIMAAKEAERTKRREIAETAKYKKQMADRARRDAINNAKAEARAAKIADAQSGAMNKLFTRGAWGAVMGVAGYAGVAGVSNIISGISSGLEDIASRRSDLEKTITPLLSLGDNVNKMGQMRAEVIGLAATMGMSNQDIANFLESLNSLSNTMAPQVLQDIKKEALQLTEFAGGDLQTNMRMLAKANETYGDSFKTINQEQNKLFKIQQDADVPMSEMAYRMPELMASAKQLGFSFDEVGAGVVATTIALGRSEGAFTGLRNVYAAMEEAQKKGITLQGSFVEKLEQLKVASDAGKVSLIDLFGRDPLAAGGALLERIDSVKESIKSLSEMGTEGDIVGKNLYKKYSDPKFVQARIYDLDKSLMENSANLAINAGSDNIFTRMHQNYRLGYHAGSAYAGDFPMVARLAGWAAMIGNDTLIQEGERQRLAYTSEGSPLRNKMLEAQFNEQKTRDEMAIWRGGGEYYKFDEKLQRNVISPEVQAIQNRKFDLEKASQDQPSLEKSLAIAAKIDETNSILRDIQIGMAKGNSAASAKPGGSKTNYEE